MSPRGLFEPLPVYESTRLCEPPLVGLRARGVRAARVSCVARTARAGGAPHSRCAPDGPASTGNPASTGRPRQSRPYLPPLLRRQASSAPPALPSPVLRAPPALPPPVQRWRRVFPGAEAELRRIRSWLAELLPSGPAREDVVTVATELAANAVRHTASGANGFFAVELTWQVRPVTVRVAVADSGARTTPHLEPGTDPLGPGPLGIGSPGAGSLSVDQLGSDQLSEHGRGLRVVRALAERTGVCGDHRGRLVWAEIRWSHGRKRPAGFPGWLRGLAAGHPRGAGGPVPGSRHLVRPRHDAVVGPDRPAGKGTPRGQAPAHGRVPAGSRPAPGRGPGHGAALARPQSWPARGNWPAGGPELVGPPASRPGREYGRL